ncbi:hypothetical protein [Serratia ureilytica]|uniref:hypothetical protein n=1 Tax=Serratia ureilytica TaxID=300181 RepID=UPI00313E430C
MLTWLLCLPLSVGAGWKIRLWPALREWGVPVGFVLAGLLLCVDGVGWLYVMSGLSGVSDVMLETGRPMAPPFPITCRSMTLCVQGGRP